MTPNLPEAEALGALSGTVLLKGGHGEGPTVVDQLVVDGQVMRSWFNHRVVSRNTHGTGCTLSSAIAAGLATGRTLEQACDEGIAYVAGLIGGSVESVGSGHGPLLHGLV